MIELKNVSFQYEGSEEGVWDVNLSIEQGECVVLTGVRLWENDSDQIDERSGSILFRRFPFRKYLYR